MTTTQNLTSTQATILQAAAARPDGAIHPLPKGIQGGAALKVITALHNRGLICGTASYPPYRDWRISEAGYQAIGLASPRQEEELKEEIDAAQATQAEAEAKPRRSRANTKQAQVIEMLKRPEGATTAQIMAATGWLGHTVRGFLSLTKKRLGVEIATERLRVVGPGQQGSPGSYTTYRILEEGGA